MRVLTIIIKHINLYPFTDVRHYQQHHDVFPSSLSSSSSSSQSASSSSSSSPLSTTSSVLFRRRHHIYIDTIGKQRALSLEVTCSFRLYLKIGRSSVNTNWKHWLSTSNYHCLQTGVPYNTDYGWIGSNVKARCSLFTYNDLCVTFLTVLLN